MNMKSRDVLSALSLTALVSLLAGASLAQAPQLVAANAAATTAAAVTSTASAVPFPDDVPKPPYRKLPDGPMTLNPGTGQDAFPFVDMYDSTVAAPEAHHVRYMNEHVRLVEVAYFPGVRGRMHGHAYSSVFAIDAPVPKSVNARLDPAAPLLIGDFPGPNGDEYPRCRTMGPQAPHAETNLDTWPHHFYRLEFLRVDGDALAGHWREWYSRLNDPLQPVRDPKTVSGGPLTANWHYPEAYDSIVAAPNNSRLLYEDNHVRLVEVSIRPGETEAIHGNPYPSVLAFDSLPPLNLPVRYADRSSPQNSHDLVKGTPPPGLALPVCATTGPQAPRALTNNTKSLVHYYRVEFKRIDGDALRTRWSDWYPWLLKYKQAWDAAPYAFNY